MTNNKLNCVLCLLAGLLYILVPHHLLPVCEFASAGSSQPHGVSVQEMAAHDGAGGMSPAHAVCFYTARAELGLGLLIVMGAILLAFSGSAGYRAGILALEAGAAAIGALFPTVLIGVCQSQRMPCRAGTLPALIILSVLFFAFSATASARSRKG
ncbi:MAG: DUF4418 family protein [Deltaproteobacteria bacterium]|jgi:hypothetical protein|nr:DUF4418 family protein [Deltaproteobacteria bacterium]